MKILFIEYPKCSTCQKAKKWLTENNIDFTQRNIVEETPSADELREYIEKSGLDIKFFNTSGLLYKSMNLKEKLNSMRQIMKKIEILSQNGMLIKRPLLIGDNFALPGFKEDKYKELLKKALGFHPNTLTIF